MIFAILSIFKSNIRGMNYIHSVVQPSHFLFPIFYYHVRDCDY